MENVYKKRSVLKILNDATYVLADYWGYMIGATALAVVSVFSWILFAPFGIVLMFFATGFISLGYINFTIDILKNKKPTIEKVYGSYKQCFSAFALRIVMVVLTSLWSVLLIVPGVVCALNYSFAMSVLCEDKKTSVFEAIEKSKQLVRGYRFEILDIYLMWFLMVLVIFGGTSALFSILLYVVPGMQVWLVFTLGGVVALLVDVLVLMPFKQICLSSIYIEAKQNAVVSKKRKAKGAQIVEEVE